MHTDEDFKPLDLTEKKSMSIEFLATSDLGKMNPPNQNSAFHFQQRFTELFIRLAEEEYSQLANEIIVQLKDLQIEYNQARHRQNNRAIYFEHWLAIVRKLSEADAVRLLKGAAIAENLMQWTGGSGTDVSRLWHAMRSVYPKAASRTGVWVRAMSKNKYSPYGGDLLSGCKTIEEHEIERKRRIFLQEAYQKSEQKNKADKKAARLEYQITRLRDSKLRSKVIASLVGLAVGDALGVTLEGVKRDSLPLHTEILGDPRRNIARGCWTDDTSMALALADSILNTGTIDPHDLMQRFVCWWKEGAYSPSGRCVDIGEQTHDVLKAYERSRKLAHDDSLYADRSGNGSIMRLAPVVLRWHTDVSMAIRMAAAQSQPTHPTAACVECCQLFASLLTDLIYDYSLDDAIANAAQRLKITTPEVQALIDSGWKRKNRDEIRSSAYVVDTLEAALWTIHKTDSFREALILAVNLGHDADTVGAVTGQFAGAIYGMDSIPSEWLAALAWRKEIEKYAHRLIEKANSLEAA